MTQTPSAPPPAGPGAPGAAQAPAAPGAAPGPAPASAAVRTRGRAAAPAPAPAPAGCCRPGAHRLSVVVRTTGARTATLEETLLCLAGQEDPVAEVLLAAHRPTPAALVGLGDLVSWARDVLDLDVRLLTVDHGQRGAPLNAGLRAATGCVVAFCDDDDHVLGGWAGLVLRGHDLDPGRVVRLQVVERPVRHAPGGGTVSTGRPTSRFSPTFCWTEHFDRNHTPIHGFALPLAPVRARGLEFDETLPVVEDWDLLLSASLWLGVTDVSGVAAVYNVHERPQRSGEHDGTWLLAEAGVRDRRWAEMRAALLEQGVVPPGLAADVARMLADPGGAPGAPAGPGLLSRLDVFRWLLRQYSAHLGLMRVVLPPGSRRYAGAKAVALRLDRRRLLGRQGG